MTHVLVTSLGGAALSKMWVSISATQRSNCPRVKSLSTAVIDCEERVSTTNVGKHSPPKPIALRSRPPSKKPTVGYSPVPAPDLARKSGSSASITAPFVAAQAASAGTAGLTVAELQTPLAPRVLLTSCVRHMSPAPALASTDPAGQLPLVICLTTYTWMFELPPPLTKLLRISTSPIL